MIDYKTVTHVLTKHCIRKLGKKGSKKYRIPKIIAVATSKYNCVVYPNQYWERQRKCKNCYKSLFKCVFFVCYGLLSN